jgi:hypothetical protein
MVLAHVSEIAIDGLGGRIHRRLGKDVNRRHTTCLSRTAALSILEVRTPDSALS